MLNHLQLVMLSGKGGVGKTTVAASLVWGLSQRYPDKKIRIISMRHKGYPFYAKTIAASRPTLRMLIRAVNSR